MSVLEAKLRAISIAKKTGNPSMKAQMSGYVKSQWQGMTSENRLAKMGHLAKESGQSFASYKKEMKRKALTENKIKAKLIKRDKITGVTLEVTELLIDKA